MYTYLLLFIVNNVNMVCLIEPSNKMKEKMALLRLEEERAQLLEQQPPLEEVKIDESQLSEEEKFLNSKFGGKK
jgi:hypothetical protein